MQRELVSFKSYMKHSLQNRNYLNINLNSRILKENLTNANTNNK